MSRLSLGAYAPSNPFCVISAEHLAVRHLGVESWIKRSVATIPISPLHYPGQHESTSWPVRITIPLWEIADYVEHLYQGKGDLRPAARIASETGERMPVVFNGPKPDQMREGAEAILEGKYNGEEFQAQSLLLKCPSRYEEGTIEEVQVEAVR